MSLQSRQLKPDEIRLLTEQLCSCDDWSKVRVAEGFNCKTVKSTHFSGEVYLGVFEKNVSFAGGVQKPAGISNAKIHNCTIGNNVYINQVANYIANYIIEDRTIIDNIDVLVVEGASSFGNGVEVAVVNEAGGREIPIYDNLSAHIAYVIAFYRHRDKVIKKLQRMIKNYCDSVTSTMGLIGKNSRLLNCRTIKNVKVGANCTIEGVDRLENGSLNSSEDEPVYIGPGVIADDFICCSGSKVSDGTIINKCFVGQGTELGKQYSADNSVFFANCVGMHGEACSVFAGPYTVTHHKSTLLIAGLFSFLNAGSGSNQSNHMYKLGPVHQGIVERGSKTTSDSYVLWPAKIGAFTVIMGRHYRNSDTSDLPFSYLIEHEDESILVPGVNLRSVGTVRDARKWPKRDKRNGTGNLDFINFKLLSPYTVQKMLDGCTVLENLRKTSGKTSEYFTYHSVKINNESLYRGIRLYQLGINKFIGNCLIKRLEGKEFSKVSDLKAAITAETEAGKGEWVDMAGLFAPANIVEKMLSDIETGAINTLDRMQQAFLSIHTTYSEYEWTWATAVIEEQLGKNIGEITAEEVVALVKKWKAAVVELDQLLYEDARKEYSAMAEIGYGVDGKETVKHEDFEAVRGKFEENSFVAEIEAHTVAKTTLGDELISRMNRLIQK